MFKLLRKSTATWQRGYLHPTIGFILLLIAGALSIYLITKNAHPQSTSAQIASPSPTKPNIVFILTDDQNKSDMPYLPKTTQLLGGSGTTFSNAFNTSNLCCPARATLLTGQYAHNNGVWTNNNGYTTFKHDQALPVWLHNAGYTTGTIGKYLNGYTETTTPQVPPGWDEWYTAYGDETVVNNTFTYYYFKFGEKTATESATRVVTYGDPSLPLGDGTDKNYATDVINAKAIDFIDRHANDTQPFFLYVNHFAPHEDATPDRGPTPPVRDRGRFSSVAFPTSPSFNEADVSDKPAFIRNIPLLTPAQQASASSRFHNRLDTLPAVDDSIEAIYNELAAKNLLNNTYIIFTSDNGYFMGEHRILNAKNQVYEEGIQAPIIIKGPNIPTQTVSKLVTFADIAPTIAQWAGATPSLTMDGVSLMPLISNPNSILWRSSFLIDGPAQKYIALRGDGGIAVQYSTGEKEVYNLIKDPNQLTASKTISISAQTELNRLKTCKGTIGPFSCWSTYIYSSK